MPVMAQTIVTLVLSLVTVTIVNAVPPLQLESKLSHLTNVLQDRDYQRIYDEHFPKDNFKGKALKPVEKLTQGIRPIHYSLFIRPILEDTGIPGEQLTAPGIVKISFSCEKETDEVHVHAVEIDIQDEYVQIRNRQKVEESVKILNREYSANGSVYKIKLESPLETDKEYILTIAFTSIVSKERLTGLYLSNYTDPLTKEIKYVATTQFESIHARKAFPCFDEPDLKATFDVSIGRKTNYHTISNMNLVMTEPILGLKGWVWDHYNTTRKMSTYLVAFIVSDFLSEEADSKILGGRPVRTWAPRHSIEAEEGVYAAKVAANVLSFYEDFFKTPYPLPKMDSIAIPHFQAGAMENWGANTYREKLLLYSGNSTTEADRYAITSVISHELAHQNFGNLVTCKRWTHLWLNEGFATYVSFLGVDSVAPEFKARDLFYTDTVQVAMKADIGKNVHAVVNDSAVNQISTGDFDKITYKKGASLIRMIEGIIGLPTLQRGLQRYLHTYAYNNVVTDDLFKILDEQAHMDNPIDHGLTIKEIMETYTLKSGYPLIRVAKGNDGEGLYISQEKFVKNKTSSASMSEMWWVPLSIKSSANPTFENTRPDLWLAKDVLVKQFVPENNKLGRSGLKHDDWVIVNPYASGYFRVLYDANLTKALQEQLVSNPEILPAVARAKLIDDYFNAASADYIPIETALGFTDYLHKETEYIVWSTVFLNLKRTYNMLRSGRHFRSLNNFLQTKVSSALNRIGMEQRSESIGSEAILRSHLLDWACNLGFVQCTRFARRMMDRWMESAPDVNPIPVDIQPVVYCSAIANAEDKKTWNFVWEKYLETNSTTEKFKLISALCCSKDEQLLRFLIAEALNATSRISKVDASVAMQRLAANSVGNELVYGRIRRDLYDIVHRFGGSEPVAYAISTLSIYWNEESRLHELQAFVRDNSAIFRPVLKLMDSSFKIIEDNVAWLRRYEQVIADWLEDRQSPAAVEPVYVSPIYVSPY